MLEKLAAHYVQKSRVSILPELDVEDSLAEKLALLPAIQDPDLFGVRANKGFEHSLVQAIMNLAIKVPTLHIASVFCREPGSGWVYVEATGPKFFDRLLRNPYLNRAKNPPIIIPLSARSELLSYPQDVIPGQWARVRKGKFKGKLAFIPPLSSDKSFPSTYLVVRPRAAASGPKREHAPSSALINFKGKQVPIPLEPDVPLGPDAAVSSRPEEPQHELWHCDLKNGDLTCLNVHPTETEIGLFRACGHTDIPDGSNEQSKCLALAEGDRVVVTVGKDAGKDAHILRIDRLFRDETADGEKGEKRHLFRMATVTITDSDTVVAPSDPIHGGQRKLVTRQVTIPVTNLRHSSAAPALATNDRVTVVAGDQQGKGGYVQDISEDCIVTVRRDCWSDGFFIPGETLESSFQVPMRCLQRHFQNGDYIKVVKGQWVDRIGWIVSLLSGGVVVVFEVILSNLSRGNSSSHFLLRQRPLLPQCDDEDTIYNNQVRAQSGRDPAS